MTPHVSKKPLRSRSLEMILIYIPVFSQELKVVALSYIKCN